MKSKSLQIIALSLIALLMSGCTQNTQTDDTSGLVELSDLSHIHSVATDGQDVYAASHHGLYVLQENKWKLRGDDFDIMGLSFDNGVFYASGHPGPLQNLPDPVGVLTSQDGGNTWSPLSLTGEVDFHLLEVVDENFIGVAASHNSVFSSTDGGNKWNTVSTPNFTDLSVNPQNSTAVLLADGNGLMLSEDFGISFKSVLSLDGVTKVEWHQDGIFAATKNNLYRGADLQGTFAKMEYKFDEISDIHAEGDLVVVMDAIGIHLSSDKGLTFDLIDRL